MLGLAGVLLALPAAAEDKPYRVSLLGDGFDGKAWRTGVLVELAPGWKTYWRMPGEAGIPPDFAWKSSAPAAVNVLFPVPGRHADQSGETVGYEGAVLFPVSVTPEKASALVLTLRMFFAVCKEICIPAEAEASTALGPQMRDPLGSARVEQAFATVPAPGAAITAVSAVMEQGKPVLKLALAESVDDVFVESPASAYFRAPRFSPSGREATLPIDNLRDAAELSGSVLRITYLRQGAGLEQTLTLP